MRPTNADFDEDAEFKMLLEWIQDKKEATKKSYKASYRKLRVLVNGDNLRDVSEDRVIKTVNKSIDKVNTRQSLFNIAITARKMTPELPHEKLIKQRTNNANEVEANVRQNNSQLKLPDITEFDAYISDLFDKKKYREFIVNYLMRNYYVRNQDLLFDIVNLKIDMEDDLNYLWLDGKKQKVTYQRNSFKTVDTYGPKTYVITDPNFIRAVKVCEKQQYAFPLTDSPEKIGYYVKKLSFKELGEGAILKMIISHYKNDINKLKEISERRGTAIDVLLTSYNIAYT